MKSPSLALDLSFAVMIFYPVAGNAADPAPTPLKLIECEHASPTTTYNVSRPETRIIVDREEPLFFFFDDSPAPSKEPQNLDSGKALDDGGTATEKPRSLQIIADLEALGSAIVKRPQKDIAPRLPKCAEFDMTSLRSNLDIKLKVKADATDHNKSYVVGPPEHFYLSADVPVTDVTQLKYDATSNKVVEAKSPAAFYFGVSYKLGDIFTNYSAYDVHNLIVKLLLRASSKPTSSIGLGIGYSTRFCDLFVARVSTSPDSGVNPSSSARVSSTMAGVSFNVAQGIAWISGK